VTLAKPASNRKSPPEPNAEAVRRMAEEKRRSIPMSVPFPQSGKRTPAVEEAFFDGMREGWSVRKSAWAAGISSVTAYAWRTASEATRLEDGSYEDDFCVRWEAAYRDGVDVLEDAAHRRAVEGVDKPVYQGGVLVGTVTEYSDTLLMLALRGKRPDRYNTERHELTGAKGGPIATSMEVEFIDSRVRK
jgi:hypothetical protein